MTRLGQPPPQAAPGGGASPGAMAVVQTLPAQLGQYRLLRPIAEGGMSVVHLAAGPDGHLVAVKVLRLPMLVKAPPLWPLPGPHGIQVNVPGLNGASLSG